jgi:hypothetical protein
MKKVEGILEMLKPYDSRKMRSYPVSTRVNYAAYDDEACSAPVEPGALQNQLFGSDDGYSLNPQK